MKRFIVASFSLATACNVDLERMLDQHKYESYEPSSVFANGMVMRHAPRGTVSTGAALGAPELVTGVEDGQYVTRVPVTVDAALLDRGQNRYQIFCQPCHGSLGNAETRVADAMSLRRPASFHEPRVRSLPAGAIFRVVSEGYGLMPAYSQLAITDRWAVVAYVQTLQLSRGAELATLPGYLRQEAEPWLR